MKNLDESKPVPVKHKDVNTFKNNQVKFTGGASSIPPEHMKCNILKARLEEDMKKGWLALPPLALTCIVTSFLCKSSAYCLTQWLGTLHFPCLSPVCLLPNPVVQIFSLVFLLWFFLFFCWNLRLTHSPRDTLHVFVPTHSAASRQICVLS